MDKVFVESVEGVETKIGASFGRRKRGIYNMKVI